MILKLRASSDGGQKFHLFGEINRLEYEYEKKSYKELSDLYAKSSVTLIISNSHMKAEEKRDFKKIIFSQGKKEILVFSDDLCFIQNDNGKTIEKI